MKRDNMLKFRSEQIWHIAKLSLAYLFSLCLKKRELWLMSERGVDARDNAYWLFLYIKNKHPEINVHYIISKDSVDRNRLDEYKCNLVTFRSLKHYILLWQASHLISTHVQGYAPFVGLGLWMMNHIKKYSDKWHIDLKHGITKDYQTFTAYENTHIDLLFCAAKPEYDYLKKLFGYPDGNLQYTGFCRFDNLHICSAQRQILVMPTWREWIYSRAGFVNSEFAKVYSDFLVNPELNSLLEENNINLVFYPHHEIQRFIDEFQKLPVGSRIIIAEKAKYDVQELLKDSALLITDYSSVFFDFSYMKKPSIYFQFDYVRYREEHLATGYFDYNSGFGPVVHTQEDLFNAIKQVIASDFKLQDIYRERIDEYFPLYDTKNTERVFNCIIKRTS